MEEEVITKKSKDELWAILIRMWFAGAIYWLFGFGTSTGEMEGDSYFWPLVGTLGIALFVSNWIIVNPMIKAMFNTRLNKRADEDKRLPLWASILKNISLLLLNIIFVYIISIIYALIGLVVDILFDSIFFINPEPILFGLLYGLVYKLFELVGDPYYKWVKAKGGKHGEHQI